MTKLGPMKTFTIQLPLSSVTKGSLVSYRLLFGR